MIQFYTKMIKERWIQARNTARLVKKIYLKDILCQFTWDFEETQKVKGRTNMYKVLIRLVL